MKDAPVVVDVSDWKLLTKAEYKKTYSFAILMRKKTIRVLEHEGRLYHLKPPHQLMMLVQGDAVWRDVIAFYIGKMIGVDVPKTWIATYKNSNQNGCGVLTEWFYDAHADNQQLVVGRSILRGLMPNYHHVQHHNLKAILDYARSIGINQAAKIWGRIMLFDLIIGNGDRHDDNWAIIHTAQGPKFAPAFDNSSAFLTQMGAKGTIHWTLDNMLHRMVRAFYFYRKAQRFRLYLRPTLGTERFTIRQALVHIVQSNMLALNEVLTMLERLDLAELSTWLARAQHKMNRALPPAYRLDERAAKLIIAFLRHRKTHILKQVASIRAN